MGILQMSITAGLLVIAIVIIRAVGLNRLPKKMFLVLWGVVLIRLLVPVTIPIPVDFINGVAESVLPVRVTQVTWVMEQPTETVQEQALSVAPITIIWLVGMLAAFIFFSIVYFKNQKVLRYAIPIRDNTFLNKWLTEHRLMRPITIMQSDRIKSPFAVGIINPRIILPKSMNINDIQVLNHVLTHEYIHIKRLDGLWKMVLLFALCVHWFNPMVWVMFILANRDLELTCDEAVIYRFGATTKKAYAYMLIRIAEQGGKFAPLYNGFSKNAAEERIESIMKMKKKSIISVILACVLVSALTIGALTVFAGNGSNQSQTRCIHELLRYITPDTPIEHRTTLIDEFGNETTVTEEELADMLQSMRFICFASPCFNPFCIGEHLNESDFTYEEWQRMKLKLPQLPSGFDDIPGFNGDDMLRFTDVFPWLGN